MKIIKLYRKPNKPEYFILNKCVGFDMLLNYPVEVPNRKRHARWIDSRTVYIEWIREFSNEQS